MKKYMATVVMALSMSVAQADTYQATNWMAPSHILNGIAFEKLAVDLKKSTNGDIDFEIFFIRVISSCSNYTFCCR